MVIQLSVPGETARQLVLDKDSVLVGRAVEADVILDGPQISRTHCRMVFKDGRWRLHDLNSANGVYLDRGGRGAPFLARTDVLQSGDTLYIGRHRLKVLMDPDAPNDATDTGGPAMDGDGVVHNEQTAVVRRVTLKEDMRAWLMEDGTRGPGPGPGGQRNH